VSRYQDRDDDFDPLAYGRWQVNARRVLQSKRGRKALRDLRGALYALPERRLIASAMCTVGGADARAPVMTAGQAAAEAAATADAYGEEDAARYAEWSRRESQQGHDRLAGHIAEDGEGVCAVGAYAWWQLILKGYDPDVAFAMLPTLSLDIPREDGGGDLSDTAKAGEAHGLVYTLAAELAYRNDETYARLTSRQRWAAFTEWINVALGDHPYPDLLANGAQ
jgi:hypothetical protein